MRHWICCRNLCLKFKSRVQLPRGVTITTDHPQYRDLLCYRPAPISTRSTLQHKQKKSVLGNSLHSAHSIVYCHNTPHIWSKYSTDRARSKVAIVVPHNNITCSYSTNSTSVCPPPTPSTQGQCLPSSESHSNDIQIPEPPTNCCMSGCANCVWITYAQELAQLYKDSGKAADSVMNAIDDPSLKMFLNLELKEKLNSEE